jgi:hypothetical protein
MRSSVEAVRQRTIIFASGTLARVMPMEAAMPSVFACLGLPGQRVSS